MLKGELFAALKDVDDGEDVKVVIADGSEHLDELEPGSVLSIEDTGYSHALRCRVIYVMPS